MKSFFLSVFTLAFCATAQASGPKLVGNCALAASVAAEEHLNEAFYVRVDSSSESRHPFYYIVKGLLADPESGRQAEFTVEVHVNANNCKGAKVTKRM